MQFGCANGTATAGADAPGQDGWQLRHHRFYMARARVSMNDVKNVM